MEVAKLRGVFTGKKDNEGFFSCCPLSFILSCISGAPTMCWSPARHEEYTEDKAEMIPPHRVPREKKETPVNKERKRLANHDIETSKHRSERKFIHQISEVPGPAAPGILLEM